MTQAHPSRRRSVVVDVIGVLAILGVAVWRTLSEPRFDLGAVAVVAVVAALFGGLIGWWANGKPWRRRPVAVGAAVVVVVFIVLVGVHGPFEGTQWAWLLVCFAGMVLGNDLPRRTRVIGPEAEEQSERASR